MTPAQIAEEVIRRIQDYPETYDQTEWWSKLVGDTNIHVPYSRLTPTDFNINEMSECGSTACVAGHTIAVGIKNNLISQYIIGTSVPARNLLGLSYAEGNYLFNGGRSKDEVLYALKEIVNGNSPLIGIEDFS